MSDNPFYDDWFQCLAERYQFAMATQDNLRESGAILKYAGASEDDLVSLEIDLHEQGIEGFITRTLAAQPQPHLLGE